MHLFVTGGTGFFGKALLRYWSAGGSPELEGARFTLLSRDPARYLGAYGTLLKDLDVRLHAGDIQRPETLPDGDYTHVLHAATDSTTGLSLTPLERFNQIVDGTRNVLDLALRCGKPRVLITSSGGVYGPQPEDMDAIPESYTGMAEPLNPQNAYSVGKRMAEHLTALYHDAHGLESVVARCFAFVGPDLPLDAHFAVGNFVRDAMAGRDIVIQGDGTPLRSYLDQRDLAEWLTTLLLRGTPQSAYNVGSDEPISIGELAARIARLPTREVRVQVLGHVTSGQAAKRNRYVPDVTRARTECGLGVRHDLDAALASTWRMLTSKGTG